MDGKLRREAVNGCKYTPLFYFRHGVIFAFKQTDDTAPTKMSYRASIASYYKKGDFTVASTILKVVYKCSNSLNEYF